MSRAKGESPRRPAGTSAHDSRGRAAARTPRPSETTDEQLGLLPTEERDRVSGVIGPDRDDAELREDDDLTFVPGGTASDIDFQEAGRQAQAEIVADETDLTRGEVQVLGGFSASAGDQVQTGRSSDGEIGDEALRDAVLSALRHDAATAGLRIRVTVVQGVVRLRGRVPDLDDAENAEAVAADVEGVLEVQEQLEISNS